MVAKRRARVLVAMAVFGWATVAVAGTAHAARATTPTVTTTPRYRHGVVPVLGAARAATPTSPTGSNANLMYGGGNDGIGVTTGPPRVYLVFWGSQWGLPLTGPGPGGQSFGGDPVGMAPKIEAFLEGLGTDSDAWSAVMSQYCEGVATGAEDCPATAAHVGYPTPAALGGVLAGEWEDTSAAAPAQATGNQLAAEAVSAAQYFGNTTQASNRNTQYVIVSPTGTHPDGFGLSGPGDNFCAWHDWSGDPYLDGGGAVNAAFAVAFTNLPYLPDAGQSCGANFVNPGAAGLLDGVTVVGGHEYAETITDQFPAGGWLDSAGNEAGDKCSWISTGAGASGDITLATGTFAVQSIWANDDNGGAGGCEISHAAVVTSPGTGPALTSANHTTFTAGIAASFTVTATGNPLPSLSETGTLPAGVTFTDNHNGTATVAASTATTTGAAYHLTLTAVNGVGTNATQSFTLTVGTPPTITSPASVTYALGAAGSFTVRAGGFPAPAVTEAGSLPAGVTFNPGSGVLSGAPASGTTGSYPIIFTAGNGIGTPATQAFSLIVNQATFTYPVNGQAAVDTTRPLTWSTIPQAQGYVIALGTTQYGTNLGVSPVLGATQSSYSLSTALPSGPTLYATLFAAVNGQWASFQGISFTAAPGQASFTYPLNGQTGVDPTKALAWSTIPQAQGYRVAVGTTHYGTNLGVSAVLPPTQTSYAPAVLPANETLYATLFTEVNGTWTRFQAVTFTTGAAMGTFTHPIQGQAAVATPGTVTWNTVAGAQGYDLVIGTTVYGSNLVSSGVLAATTSSFPMPALPTGKALYATLLTEVNGAWAYQLVVFTAA